MGDDGDNVRGWLRWKVPPIQAAKRESYVMSDREEVSFVESQLLSKTNWLLVGAVVFYALKFFGVVETIPDGYELGFVWAAGVNAVLKLIKWVYFEFIRKSE